MGEREKLAAVAVLGGLGGRAGDEVPVEGDEDNGGGTEDKGGGMDDKRGV